jgi:hypothetical protein
MTMAVTKASAAEPSDSPSIKCDATAPDTIRVTFPASVDAPSATDPSKYTVSLVTGPGAPFLSALDNVHAKIQPAQIDVTGRTTAVFITLIQHVPSPLTLTGGQWIQVNTSVVSSNNITFTQVHDVGDALGNIATNTGGTSRSLEDLAAFSLLTEEVGYPPSPLARPSGWGGAIAPAAGGMLGQTAMKAVSDVLGWQVKPDPKGFLGALNASFKLEEVEGHTQAIWTPRTYAIQTDLSGGITGAQASVYQRAKDALDKSLPLLDGLYPLDKEAKDEDVAALRATVRSQFTDLVNELGLIGGPRISRVTQFFFLLLGQQLPQNFSGVQLFVTGAPNSGGPLQTDPDKISGSLGNLRGEFGFGIADDQVNTVEDEQDVTNFRIVTDYVTSLAQSWLNNLQFFGLGTPTPFFGTQLVLLSRQLSVIAESVNEVRFTLDSVFIGPAERQTLQIDFGPPAPIGTPPMFLEDLLTWIDSFASVEGPRLIQDGGKFAVGESFVPIGTQLQTLVAGAVPDTVTPANVLSLPRGYRTKRVQRSLEELRDQLQELVNLAAPISHVITPEPEHALAVLVINPNVMFLSALASGQTNVPITIIGTGFDTGITNFTTTTPPPLAGTVNISAPRLNFGPIGSFSPASENLIVVQLTVSPPPTAGNYVVTITVTNRDGKSATLQTSFAVLP